jgi:hypothetical protein
MAKRGWKPLNEIEDNYPRMNVEKSRPGDIPPGDEDIYYPGDINPDVWDALQRGDYGHDDYDINDWAEDRIDLMANYDDYPAIHEGKNDEIIKNIVDAVLNNKELLSKAIQNLSPRFSMFPQGSTSKQMKWRFESFISNTPEIFKGIMSLPLRKKVCDALYNELRMRYRQYF